MLSIYQCVTIEHDLRLILLAAAICTLAVFTAFGLTLRAMPARTTRLRNGWLVAAAVVTGLGTWATHFVAMLAYDGGVSLSYDGGVTFLSVMVAVVVSGVGFFVALVGKMPLLGGAVVGLSIAAMHYVGIAAIKAPASLLWDYRFVAASVVISVSFAAVSFWVGTRRTSFRVRAISPLLMFLAIVGLHFTGMTAMTWLPFPDAQDQLGLRAPDLLAVAVAAVIALIVFAGLASAQLDRHLAHRNAREAERLRAHVTELEQTKAELEQRTREVTEALNVAAAGSQAKSQFLATMSHELRTPLNAIIGFSSMQVDEVMGPLGHPSYAQYARDIKASGEHLLALINDILDIARIDTNHLELDEAEVDIDDLVRRTARMVEQQAREAGVLLQVDAPAGLPAIVGDERRLRQVMLNLLSNAIKFTPAPGSVTLSVASGDGELAIAVRDTGIGMTPQQVEVALQRFGQVENGHARRFEGAGLGLPLAAEFVKLHGGTMSVDSEHGRGTTVTVRVPMYRDDIATAHAA
ncbi:MAG: MHYT domain-containing protein [Alphaproteobacteria bacterium]